MTIVAEMGLWNIPPLDMTSVVGGTLAVIAVTITAIYLYAIRNFGYWRRKNVPYIKPLPFAGNIKDVLLFRRHIGPVLQEEYNKIKGQRYIGMYLFDRPVLFVRDISLWKNIMSKDSDHFIDRAFYTRKSEPFLSEALFQRKGKYWKDLRVKLTPAFTSGKLKRFFVLLEQKAANLDNYFDDAVQDGKPRDISDACGRYTTDAVATVGFGIETSALTDDNDHLRSVLKNVFVYSKSYLLMMLAAFMDISVLKILRPTFIPLPLVSFLRSAVWSVIGERERAGSRGQRGDYLDLLMELREKGSISTNDSTSKGALLNGDTSGPGSIENGAVKQYYSSSNSGANISNDNPTHVTAGMKSSNRIEMDGDILISQAVTFFAAGYDTSATTMSFALYELAMNQQIQEELRTHIRRTMDEYGGKLTYDVIQNCTYLDMVFSETLRLYPILSFLDRICTKTYRIPDSDLVIEKGTIVLTSVLGIQRDPDYFTDPERFDPQRFSEKNKVSLIPGAYFPFGDGPRICIGMRLGVLQAKLGLAHILLNYRLHPCAETPRTMEFNLYTFFIQPRNGVPLKFTRV